MMSVVRFTGGLGNQLFQICFGKMLSDATATPTVYDAIEYKYRSTKATRQLEIPDIFGLKIESKSNAIISHSPEIILKFMERRVIPVYHANRYKYSNFVREGVEIYDSGIELKSNSYYIGNFISYKYWNNKTQHILSWISNLMNEHLDLNKNILDSTIGIHVRRGDYLENDKVRNLHGYCTDEYYLDALDKIIQANSSIKRVLLSSDSPFRTRDLRNEITKRGLYIEVLDTTNPLEALTRIAKTSYFIGSNSTFSWWAAALNKKEISIFPNDWFIAGSYGFDFNDYFPFPVTGITHALTNEPLI